MAREHARAFAALDGVELCGVVGRSTERAAALAADYGMRSYEDLDALWAAEQPDLLIITVNTVILSRVIEAAVAWPWVLFMEKPPGCNLHDALRIEAMLGGRTAYVALNRRFLGSTIQTRQRLASDPGPFFITVSDQQDIEAFAAMPGKDRLEANNLMYANSIHLIDYFHALGRAPITDVQPVAPFEPRRTLCQLARIVYANGDEGLYQGVWQGAGGWGVKINTPAGCYEMRPLESGSFMAARTRVPQPYPADPDDAAFKPGFHKQARTVVSTVRGQSQDAISFAEGLKTMRLINAIFGGYQFEP
jgi:predicted dehydrogenase